MKDDKIKITSAAIEPYLDLRNYACIHLKVPKTDCPWLNDIIRESLKSKMEDMSALFPNHKIAALTQFEKKEESQ